MSDQANQAPPTDAESVDWKRRYLRLLGRVDSANGLLPMDGRAGLAWVDGNIDVHCRAVADEFSTVSAQRDAAEARVRELKARVEYLESEPEFRCPECGGFDVEEYHYKDDFSSMRCNACRYTGDPGEDFPDATKLIARVRELEAERRALLGSLTGLADAIESAENADELEANLRACIANMQGGSDGE